MQGSKAGGRETGRGAVIRRAVFRTCEHKKGRTMLRAFFYVIVQHNTAKVVSGAELSSAAAGAATAATVTTALAHGLQTIEYLSFNFQSLKAGKRLGLVNSTGRGLLSHLHQFLSVGWPPANEIISTPVSNCSACGQRNHPSTVPSQTIR